MLPPGAMFGPARAPSAPSGGFTVTSPEFELWRFTSPSSATNVRVVDDIHGVAVDLEAAPGERISFWTAGANPQLVWWTSLPRWSGVLPLPLTWYDARSPARVMAHEASLMVSGATLLSMRTAPSPDSWIVYEHGSGLSVVGDVIVRPVSVSGLAGLAKDMFKGCTGLKSVGGAKWTSFPEGVFSGCTGLEECPVPARGSQAAAGSPLCLGRECFRNCSSMPGNDGSILSCHTFGEVGADCLHGCDSLSEVSAGDAGGPLSGTAAKDLATASGFGKASSNANRTDGPRFRHDNRLVVFADGAWRLAT